MMKKSSLHGVTSVIFARLFDFLNPVAKFEVEAEFVKIRLRKSPQFRTDFVFRITASLCLDKI